MRYTTSLRTLACRSSALRVDDQAPGNDVAVNEPKCERKTAARDDFCEPERPCSQRDREGVRKCASGARNTAASNGTVTTSGARSSNSNVMRAAWRAFVEFGGSR